MRVGALHIKTGCRRQTRRSRRVFRQIPSDSGGTPKPTAGRGPVGNLTKAALQEIRDVQRLDVAGSGFVQTRAHLEQAAGVGGDDAGGTGLEDVLDLAALEAFGHFWLREVVAARAAAAAPGEHGADEPVLPRAQDRLPAHQPDRLRVFCIDD